MIIGIAAAACVLMMCVIAGVIIMCVCVLGERNQYAASGAQHELGRASSSGSTTEFGRASSVSPTYITQGYKTVYDGGTEKDVVY